MTTSRGSSSSGHAIGSRARHVGRGGHGTATEPTCDLPTLVGMLVGAELDAVLRV
jgi:hypothetical protein